MRRGKENNWLIWVVIILLIVLVIVWIRTPKESEDTVVNEEFEEKMRLLKKREDLETEKEIIEKHNEKVNLVRMVLDEMAKRFFKRVIFTLGMLALVLNLIVFFAFSGYDFEWIIGINSYIVLLLTIIEFAIYRKVKGFQKRISKGVKEYIYFKYFGHRTAEFFKNKEELSWKRVQEIEDEILEIDYELSTKEGVTLF